jgi:hypothetical protein
LRLYTDCPYGHRLNLNILVRSRDLLPNPLYVQCLQHGQIEIYPQNVYAEATPGATVGVGALGALIGLLGGPIGLVIGAGIGAAAGGRAEQADREAVDRFNEGGVA